MKSFRQLCPAIVLTLALATSALAGETSNPPCAPGETNGPPCAAPGDMQGPGMAAHAGDMDTPALNVLLFALSLLAG